ncbi:MAG: hypothetical protein ACP5D7_25435 [Limnospira sp.]
MTRLPSAEPGSILESTVRNSPRAKINREIKRGAIAYFSIPMGLKDTAIAAGIFFASLLMLTYTSRLVDPRLAWTVISGIWLLLMGGLGSNRWSAGAAIACTVAGGVLPVFALLVPYGGLTLGVVGLLSVAWLAVRHWYGFWKPTRGSKNPAKNN